VDICTSARTEHYSFLSPYQTFSGSLLILLQWDFELLFRCIDLPTVLQVLIALLLERKVIIFSKHKRLLTPISQTLLALLFPLEWQYSCSSFQFSSLTLRFPLDFHNLLSSCPFLSRNGSVPLLICHRRYPRFASLDNLNSGCANASSCRNIVESSGPFYIPER
jgi:hypothetical protein